ncbi:MAG: ATPase [Bacteroidales bacterium]|nr:ATPase [Bacteroidales bacterium]
MAVEENPFVTMGLIGTGCFCGRENEMARLIKFLTNGNNVVLISPRRMGKTALVQSCYRKPIIKNNYRAFLIDILNTSSLREFTFLLGKSIYETLLPRGRKFADQFMSFLKSINKLFEQNDETGHTGFNINMGGIEEPEITLEEIFKYLDNADKPCIVTINEFQQICKYPGKNMEIVLYSYIKNTKNCRFIFSGSETHIMGEMFLSGKRPFYMSSDMLELGPIPPETYIPFVENIFKKNGRKIAKTDVELVYNLFKGHTFYVQKTFNVSFSNTPEGGTCTLKTIQLSLDQISEEYSPHYRKIMSNIPERQKELLCAIAKDVEATQLTSIAFIKRHNLASASSIQAATIKLLENEIITENDKVYSVYDRFFAIWINNTYNTRLNICR